jgi:hypothetical protein
LFDEQLHEPLRSLPARSIVAVSQGTEWRQPLRLL